MKICVSSIVPVNNVYLQEYASRNVYPMGVYPEGLKAQRFFKTLT